MNKYIVILTSLFSLSSYADNLLLFSSGRTQNINNCWAHAAAAMLESQYEIRNNVSVVTEVGDDLQTLNIYNRLMHSYRTKKAFDGGQVSTDLGWTGEYFKVLSRFGLLLRASEQSLNIIPYQYPNSAGFKYSKTDSLAANYNAAAIEKELVSGKIKSEQEADQLIRKYLPVGNLESKTTQYLGKALPRNKTYGLLVPFNLSNTQGKPITVTLFSQEKNPSLSLGAGVQGTLDFFVVPKQSDILQLVRYSIDAGYVASYETTEHAMAFLGYKTIDAANKIYSYAVSDSNSGVRWYNSTSSHNSSTIFYSVVESELDRLVPEKGLLVRPQVVEGVFNLMK